MSLADLYREQFGEPEVGDGISKEACDQALNEAVESLTEDEAEKLAQVCQVLDEENIEFDHDLQKLAAAAEIVDEYDEYEESEKTAAAEVEAGGRLFARAMVDELNQIGVDDEGQSLSDKLFS